MFVSFEELPGSARVWIYQSDRILSAQDIEAIKATSEEFLGGWAAHGAPLKSSFQVLHDKFLVIAVDESFNLASGCSIDASVGLIRNLEQNLGINFFDRTKVCFLINDEVFESPITELKKLIEAGTIQANTPTFNTLASNKSSLDESWMIPAEESWLKRYF